MRARQEGLQAEGVTDGAALVHVQHNNIKAFLRSAGLEDFLPGRADLSGSDGDHGHALEGADDLRLHLLAQLQDLVHVLQRRQRGLCKGKVARHLAAHLQQGAVVVHVDDRAADHLAQRGRIEVFIARLAEQAVHGNKINGILSLVHGGQVQSASEFFSHGREPSLGHGEGQALSCNFRTKPAT